MKRAHLWQTRIGNLEGVGHGFIRASNAFLKQVPDRSFRARFDARLLILIRFVR